MMSYKAREIERQVLKLSAEEREALANRLLASLCEAPLNPIDEVWVTEAEHRYQNLKTGRTQGIPGDKIFPQIRQELGWPNRSKLG
jgi:putative addiction module component (TIGR02574 family)